MSDERRVDAVVIGSGPGGYPCGIRLGQLGVDVVVVERGNPGGVCLNVGCIPSKALIHAAKMFHKAGHGFAEMGISTGEAVAIDMAKLQSWKGGIVNKLTGGVKHLLKANGADLVQGTARLEAGGRDGHRVVVEDEGGASKVLIAKNIVIATGSSPFTIPGFEIDDRRVIDSTGALALDAVPDRLVVIGGGYIGLELGMVYAKLGSKVSVIEAAGTLLSGMDPDCVKVVSQKLRKLGVEVVTHAMAKGWNDKGEHAVVVATQKSGDGSPVEIQIDADKILVSVGRVPNTNGLGLSELGVQVSDRGFIEVDAQMRTNIAGVYALGDVVGGMMLAHKATKEAEVCADVIAGKKAAFDVRTIPAVVFTDPEIASTGMTEAEAKEAGFEVTVGKFPFAALGRALSVGDTAGFCKLVADAKSEEVLGAHIVGNGAADLISECALAIEMGAVLHDLALTIHPHPTLSEAIMEASAAALGEAIHIVNR